jgi:hypothetical protein
MDVNDTGADIFSKLWVTLNSSFHDDNLSII